MILFTVADTGGPDFVFNSSIVLTVDCWTNVEPLIIIISQKVEKASEFID